MATHSSILAWRIPWTEEPGGVQSIGSHRVRHDIPTECLSTLIQEVWLWNDIKNSCNRYQSVCMCAKPSAFKRPVSSFFFFFHYYLLYDRGLKSRELFKCFATDHTANRVKSQDSSPHISASKVSHTLHWVTLLLR